MMADGDKITVGAPAVANAYVEAKVVRHLKDDKVIVFKKKRRKGYRVKKRSPSVVDRNCHRICLELVKSKKTAPKAKAEAPKAAAPKAAKKAASKAVADFSSKTVAELKELAKAAGIAGISSMKKSRLDCGT